MRQYLLLTSVLSICTNAITISTLAATTPDISAILNPPTPAHSVSKKQRPSRTIVTPQRDYTQVLPLATTLIKNCYGSRDSYSCSKLSQLKATLSNWCGRGDRNGCEFYSLVSTMETMEQVGNIR